MKKVIWSTKNVIDVAIHDLDTDNKKNSGRY